MTETGFPGVWDEGFWDNNVWEDVPPPDIPPDTDDYFDTGATHSIEFSVTLRLEQEIPWSRPPPAITPLRNFRAVMGDYRVVSGRPVSPPTLDCAVPILVSVDPKGVAVPSDSRALPTDLDIDATLRWCAADQYYSTDEVIAQWWDTTGTVTWSAYDTFQPVLDDTYDYQIARPNNAEIVQRSALMFNSANGTCMNTSLSINPINNAESVEFFMVLWTHPLIGVQQYSVLLDNGQSISGTHDLPWIPGDSLSGRHQAFYRYPDKLVLWQDTLGIPLHSAQVSSGRPVLYRIRFGVHPLIETWGPSNTHLSYKGPVQDQAPLCSDYVLNRMFNRVDPVTNGGMHLFEVDYFDHELSTAEAAAVVAELNSCYAISS